VIAKIHKSANRSQQPPLHDYAGTDWDKDFNPAGRYQVFCSEGGHADFVLPSELEFQLLKYPR